MFSTAESVGEQGTDFTCNVCTIVVSFDLLNTLFFEQENYSMTPLAAKLSQWFPCQFLMKV
jgi:hypothetical protein